MTGNVRDLILLENVSKYLHIKSKNILHCFDQFNRQTMSCTTQFVQCHIKFNSSFLYSTIEISELLFC